MERKNEETKEEVKERATKTFIVKKKSQDSLPAAYFEYFNDDQEEDASVGSEELELDRSMITTFENENIAEISLWEKAPNSESKEAEGENSDEEIKTFRVSNNCTPIEELEGSKLQIDPIFLKSEDNKKILNNLFYGNYKTEPKEKPKAVKPLEEGNIQSRNQCRLDTTITKKSFNNSIKFSKIKTYNYAQKLANASGNRKKDPAFRTVDRSTPINKNKRKLMGSLEEVKTDGKNSSMQMAQSNRYLE